MFKPIIPTIFRILIGFVFLFSSITKLISIDVFEVYIYGFEWLSLNASYIFARLIIGFELVLGLLFISNIYFRLSWLVSMFTLAGFTIFLSYLLFIGNNDNCNCFGDIIQLNPLNSIFKNLLFIILLILSFRNKSGTFKFRKIIFISLIIIGLAIPNIVSPPDNFLQYDRKIETKFDIDKFNTSLNNFVDVPESFLTIKKQNKVICFVSSQCNFCKLAVKKIEVIAKKAESNDNILLVFFGEPENINSFLDETNTKEFNHIILSVPDFFEQSTGKIPEILLLDKGNVIKRYGYRDIVEKDILSFLSSEIDI